MVYDQLPLKRVLLAVFLSFVAFAAFAYLNRFYSRKFYVTTGNAQWIWDQHRLASEQPVVFFATREFDIPPNPEFVHIKVAADPEYILYFNGTEMGGRRFRGTSVADVYDVTKMARPGTNRIVVAVRSAKGVGGLLVSADLGTMLENILVTDDQWKLFHTWSDELLRRDPPQLTWVKPRLLGTPPVGRWDYLTEVEAQARPEARIAYPKSETEFAATLPMIRVVSGVAVRSSRRTVARAFDFGPIKGRARIEVQPVGKLVTKIRYVNHPSEFAFEGEVVPLPVASGERVVIDPERRYFRYIIVYDIDARATVLVE
jgi:hypothetical protein